MIAWDDAGEQRARRKARAVDDQVLTGLAQLFECVDVLADFIARIVNDVDFCERRSRDERRHERADHGSLPSHVQASHPRSPDHCQFGDDSAAGSQSRERLGEQVADTGVDAADRSVAESRTPVKTKNTTPPACTGGAISTPGVDQLNG